MKGEIIIIYLDNASGTKTFDSVNDVMLDVLKNHWGNPSALYELGDDARKIIERVRDQIAEDINASPEEVIFTSGAAEANSLAIDGYTSANCAMCLTTKMEHSSINDASTIGLYKDIKNDRNGFVKMNHITTPYKRSVLISVGAANSEIGVIQDLKEISKIIHESGNLFHTDATQLFPERRLDVQELDIDMMSVSAQKFNGPRGTGFLYVRNGINLDPIIYGSQEGGLRGGTYNTAAIAGMGEALRCTRRFKKTEKKMYVSGYIEHVRNKLLDKLMLIPGATLNGPPVGPNRLANNINITVDGVNADRLVTLCSLYGIYIGKGSACKSYDPKPSHVLKAIGLSDEQCFNTVRITVGYFNTEEEVNRAAEIITNLVEKIRNEEE